VQHTIRFLQARWIITGMAATAAGLAVALPLLVLGGSAAAGTASPGSPVPVSAVKTLTAIADSFAKNDGDAHPTSISAVVTTHAKALASATPGDITENLRATVYLITMKGQFTGYMASVPYGQPLPKGRYLSIIIYAATMKVADWGLSQPAPQVSSASLGPLTYLK
jgi:hypothetical protein